MAEGLNIIKTVAPLKVNEGFPLRPVDLAKCIDNAGNTELVFEAKLESGDKLPKGIACTKAGVLSGIPAKKTAKADPYKIKVTAENDAGTAEIDVILMIYPALSTDEIGELYKSAWEELAKTEELPASLQEIVERPISKDDVYYLLSRYASFTVWNADDMRLAGDGGRIEIGEISDKFDVYDFEVCLVATPKDLYDTKRTMGDAVKTAIGMLREVHKRKWHVEFGGFDRMANVAWYEAMKLNNESDHKMEVRNYEPPEMRAKHQASASGGNA
jgi:hypothetical protein